MLIERVQLFFQSSLCQLSHARTRTHTQKPQLLYPQPWVAGHRFPAEVTGKVNSSEHAVFTIAIPQHSKSRPQPSLLSCSKSHTAL